MELLKGLNSYSWLPALSTNIRLRKMLLTFEKTIAYYHMVKIAGVKSFIVQALGFIAIVKLFSSSLTVG